MQQFRKVTSCVRDTVSSKGCWTVLVSSRADRTSCKFGIWHWKVKKWRGSQHCKIDRKKDSRSCKKALKQIYTQFLHHLLWKKIATTWYSDSHSNNVWWTTIFTFCFCFTYFSFIFNNSHIILPSTLQNQSNQHLQSISSFTVGCCGSLPSCLCGGAGLPCGPNQRCLAHQQWIPIAVIHPVRTTTIPSNAKQSLMGIKHWCTTCSRVTWLS